jgi:hypothetical protein
MEKEKKMVGMARFERATPASRTQCPTKLGHIPTPALNNQFEMNCPSFFSVSLKEDPVCVFGIDMVGTRQDSFSGEKS